MSFQVGDRVRLVTADDCPAYQRVCGCEGTVTEVVLGVEVPLLKVKFDNGQDVPKAYAWRFVKVMSEWVKTPDGVVAQVEEVTAGGAKRVGGVYYDPSRLTPVNLPKPLPEVPEDADTMLRMVDRFLSRGDKEAQHLAAVLSALRGPDEKDKDKFTTTTAVRCAALPETRNGKFVGWSFSNDGYVAPSSHDHFNAHILDAVYALKEMGRKVK